MGTTETRVAHVGIRSRCTLCGKDLTQAVTLLGFEAARAIHVTAHLRDDMTKFVCASRRALVALEGASHPDYYDGMQAQVMEELRHALEQITGAQPRAELADG